MTSIREQLERAQEKIAALEYEVSALRETLHHMPQAAAVFDHKMQYIGVSERFITDYNIADQPILGRSHYEVFPEIPPRWKAIHERVLKGSTEKSKSDYFERADGTKTHNTWECHPWYTNTGEIGGLIMYTDVITDEAFKEQITLQQMLQLVLDASPVRVFWKDRNSVLMGGNKLLLQDWGLSTVEELIGKRDDDFFPGTAEHYRTDDQWVMTTGEPLLNREEPLITKDGQQLWIHTNKVPLRDVDGTIIGVLGAYADITHRKLAEAERERLLKERTRLNKELEKRVTERTRDLELAMDISRQMSTVLDLEQLLQQIVQMTLTSFCLGSAAIFLYDSGGNISKTIAATASQNMTRDFSEISVPIKWNTELIGILHIQRQTNLPFSEPEIRVFQSLADQTAVAVRNAHSFAEAQAARTRAEQSDKIKSSFLATMSHELRTPLNTIINFSKFVHRGVMGPVTDRQKEALDKVIKSSQHLLSLINDVLDISKIEAGSLVLFVEDNLDLQQIVQSAVETAAPLLQNKPIEIDTHFDSDLPLMTGDRKRILQIVLNLVSNACKFTMEGFVRVVLQHEGDSVLIAVQDTGPGIPSHDQTTIFDAFKQSETGLRLSSEGTGLGLAITRSLVSAHGGQIWLESEVGKGTTFYVRLPIRAQS